MRRFHQGFNKTWRYNFFHILIKFLVLPTCTFNNPQILTVYFGQNSTILPNETIILKKSILKPLSTVFSSNLDEKLEFKIKSPISPVNFN